MRPIFLREEEISEMVTIHDAMAAVEAAFRDQAALRASNNPRSRLTLPGAMLHMMAAAVPGYFGYKAYSTAPGKSKFLFFLFDSKTSDLVAVMQADRLGQLRTGAATGVATRLLCDPNAGEVALIGAGWQAETQLLAVCAVRNVRRVWVTSRTVERRDAFIEKMRPQVNADLVAVVSAETAVQGSHVVITITSGREPVLKGAWLHPGTHVNAAGGNSLLRKEIDEDTVRRADRIVVDSIEQAKIECGEFVPLVEAGRLRWENVFELKDVVSGLRPGRKLPTEITLFKSLGIALEDVALAKLVYERAMERRVGKPLEL